MNVIQSKAAYHLAETATTIGLSCDATTVQQHHFMGGVIRFLFKQLLESDMFGSADWSTTKVDCALNPILLGHKYSKEVRRNDGSEFLPETPLALHRALFYSGAMPICADFAGKMGICMDGAGDNHGTAHSKDSLCGKNSPMERMLVLQDMWGVVVDEAKENGLYAPLVQCWDGESLEELTQKCKQLSAESRRQDKASSKERKASVAARRAARVAAKTAVPAQIAAAVTAAADTVTDPATEGLSIMPPDENSRSSADADWIPELESDSDSESDGSTTEDSEDSEEGSVSGDMEVQQKEPDASRCHARPAPVGREAPRRLDTSGQVKPWNGCCRHQDGCPSPAKCLVLYMLEQKKPRAFTEDLPSPLIASRLMRCILLHWFARVRLPGAKLPPLDGMPAGVRISKGREVVQKPKKFRSESSIINDCIPLLVTPRSKQIHQIIIVFLSGPRNCPKRSARMQSNYL
jgi:hypothetical protein